MLRQRTWAIMIRPYHTRNIGGGVRINYKGVPKAGNASDLGYTGADYATRLEGNMLGGTDGTSEPILGGWTVWYTGTSFKKVRQKYKELLDQVAKEHTMVTEIIPADTLVTPLT